MSLKVIGAGFGRTATASLKIALETLLGGRCYHMSEVLGTAGHIDLWLEAAAGRADWGKIFDGYVATVDYPGSFYWKEMADAYPDAKVLLSVRDPNKWFDSTQETIFSKRIQEATAGTKWARMLKATIFDHLGGDLTDRDTLVSHFEAHTEKVKSAIDPDRLLIFEAKDGWEPLCGFLDVPVPEEPFPRVNSKEDFATVFELLSSPVGPAVMNGEGFGGGSVHDEVF
ncbi:MAG: sulfotransferase family protein [Pseudomonadota bacterium]